jgi:hypothetical protein
MKAMHGKVKGHLCLKRYSLLCLALLLSSVFIFIGCADVKVKVHRHLYKPDIPASVANFYKGKQIDLNGFLNKDEHTKVWTYFSPDKKIAYEASVPLEYYVMDCFRDAFWLSGASVLKDSPDMKIPDLAVIIDSWTDREMKFTASVMRDNNLKFRNQYVVTMPAGNVNDPAQLEKNAYEMINKAIVAVMSDKNFQAAIK